MVLAKIVFGNKLLCPVCKNKLLKKKDYFWCNCCRKKLRAKALTWLKGSKMSHQSIIRLIFCWQRNVNPGSVRNTLGLSYTTISRWYSKFRTNLPRNSNLLNGTVEVDEAFFGRRKYNNQRIVIGAVERKTNMIRLKEIPDREQDSIEYFLWKAVNPESCLHTDCHSGYYDIGWNGYGHELHNHSRGHFRGTNRIENVWSVVKRQIRRLYGQIRTKKLPEFIVEWEARRNFKHLFDNPISYLEETLVPY
jgi:transposase-like protein